jgi:hypothetical protein
MKATVFLLSTFLLFSCTRQPAVPSNDEIYTILNEIITDDSLYIPSLCSEPDYVDVSWEVTEALSEDDITFLKKQQAQLQSFKFHFSILKFQNHYLQKEVEIKIDSTCNSSSVHRFSVPLVSLDRTKVLIKITDDCNCMLGGSGGTYLYEKINGHWKVMKSWGTWIS